MATTKKQSKTILENLQKRVQPIVNRLRDGDAKGLLRDARHTVERRVDASVHRFLNALQIATADDIVRMKAELGQISKRLGDIERRA